VKKLALLRSAFFFGKFVMKTKKFEFISMEKNTIIEKKTLILKNERTSAKRISAS